MSSIIHIKGQFDLYQTITAFVPGHVRISRTDGQKIPYLRESKYAASNWKKFCDEVDSKLQAVNEAKRTLRLYGTIPVLGLIGTILFVIIYTAATNKQFLFRLGFGSIFTVFLAVTFTTAIIVLEYRMRLKCAKAWREVNYSCKRYSSNVIQFRLNHDKNETFAGPRHFIISRKYYISVLTPSDRSFEAAYPAPKRRKPLMTPIFEDEELKREHTPMISTGPVDVDSFITNPSSRSMEDSPEKDNDIDHVVLDLETMEPRLVPQDLQLRSMDQKKISGLTDLDTRGAEMPPRDEVGYIDATEEKNIVSKSTDLEVVEPESLPRDISMQNIETVKNTGAEATEQRPTSPGSHVQEMEVNNESTGTDNEEIDELDLVEELHPSTPSMVDLDDDSYYDDIENDGSDVDLGGSNPSLPGILKAANTKSPSGDLEILGIDSNAHETEFDAIYEEDEQDGIVNEIIEDEETMKVNRKQFVDKAFNADGFLPAGFLPVEQSSEPVSPLTLPKYKNRRVSWRSLGNAMAKQSQRRKQLNYHSKSF